MARPELSFVVDCSASLVAAADAAEEEEEARTTCRLILLLFADDSFHTRTTVFALLVKDALVEEDFIAREDVDEDCVVVVVVNPPPPLDAKTRCTSVNFPPPRKQRCDNIVIRIQKAFFFLLLSSVHEVHEATRARMCVVRGRGSALRVRCVVCACVYSTTRARKKKVTLLRVDVDKFRRGKSKKEVFGESAARAREESVNLEAREIYMN